MPEPSHWRVQDRFLELRSRWTTLIGEHLETEQGEQLEYWRVERADSAIVLPIHRDALLLPAPMYRPGISAATWDFPGGRVPAGETPIHVAPRILRKELGVAPSAIAQITPLNETGWAVNSSFSNQRLYGFVAQLQPEATLLPTAVSYPLTETGLRDLLQLLTCLQCRAVLLEWLLSRRSSH
jgi:8-oxo-dGTP pyrophosphatase MutT (NUDIX family)